MLHKSIAEMIMKGESVMLTAYDETCSEVRILQRTICSLGRQSGIGCNIITHKTKKGDVADIRIGNLLPNHQSYVVSILSQTPLEIILSTNGEQKKS